MFCRFEDDGAMTRVTTEEATAESCASECDKIRKLLTDNCRGFTFRPEGGGFNAYCLLNTRPEGRAQTLVEDGESNVYQFDNATSTCRSGSSLAPVYQDGEDYGNVNSHKM